MYTKVNWFLILLPLPPPPHCKICYECALFVYSGCGTKFVKMYVIKTFKNSIGWVGGTILKPLK